MSEVKNIITEAGMLHFDITTKREDSDLKFRQSIRNILILIKDFYGSDTCVFYWFNNIKKHFKLLITTESTDNSPYQERFQVGLDPISKICLNNESGIFNINSDESRAKINYYKNKYDYFSLIAHSVSVDDEVIGAIFCESRTPDFFGEPNLHTLRVFSEAISNYIRLYSLQEDFENEDNNLKIIASNKIQNYSEIFEMIKNTVLRYISAVNLTVVTRSEDGFKIGKIFELSNPNQNKFLTESIISSGSLTSKSLNNKKILLHTFRRGDAEEYRYNENETFNLDINYCVFPVILGNNCLGAVTFDSENEIDIIQRSLPRIYKSIFPLFMYLNLLGMKSWDNVYSDDSNFYNNKFFIKRLKNEITKSKLLTDSTLFTVLIKIDGVEPESKSEDDFGKIQKYFLEELKILMNNYDQIYLLNDNVYSMIINAEDHDKIYVELEKIRKHISTKIFKINNKDITITISLACKKYDDFSMSSEKYLDELNELLKAAEREGGDLIKI